jgi:hypothetical protein
MAHEVTALPDAIIKAQQDLAPYIKTRQEASRIRRVLARCVESQIECSPGHSDPSILSLPRRELHVKPVAKSTHGLYAEYLRALKANVKARHEYDAVSSASATSSRSTKLTAHHGSSSTYDNASTYSDLIRLRKRQQRLRILQDYVERLDRKAQAAISSIAEGYSPDTLPRLPAELSTVAGLVDSAPAHQKDLQDIINDLQKTLLQSKASLRYESQLLQDVKARTSAATLGNDSVIGSGVQALGKTRAHLIKWMEEELSTNDSASEDEERASGSDTSKYPKSLSERLDTVKAGYARYVKARSEFLGHVSDPISSDAFQQLASTESPEEANPVDEGSAANSSLVVVPYLEDLLSIASERKSLMQQKSFLSVSLAKQHKEANQVFDRLALESHLLPASPMSAHDHLLPVLGVKGPKHTETGGAEMPNTSRRAEAWTAAAESARASTKSAVLANTEAGTAALEDARSVVLDIKRLIVENTASRQMAASTTSSNEEVDLWTSDVVTKPNHHKDMPNRSRGDVATDLWSSLDGNMGVLNT